MKRKRRKKEEEVNSEYMKARAAEVSERLVVVDTCT